MGFKKILVGYDGSNHARKAVRSACDIAEDSGSQDILVLKVVEYYVTLRSSPDSAKTVGDPAVITAEDRALFAEEIGELTRNCSAPVRFEIAFGTPKELLTDKAKEEGFDLIVVGSRGLSEIAGRLGSVSYGILSHSPVPVLVVK